jgi:polyribonucleotide 5'-hydroxyl-kinase
VKHVLAGAASIANPLRVTPVKVGVELIHTLLAVSHANTPDQIINANVAGFVHVTDVNMATGEVTYLAPNTQPFPGRYLVAGNVTMSL